MSEKDHNLWLFPMQPGVEYKQDYYTLCLKLQQMGPDRTEDKREVIRRVFREDLFALMYFGFGRRDINTHGKKTQWIVDVCREIEEGPQTDTVDLWSREHYKSTFITQGKTVQDILNIPNLRVGIFSHTRPIAKDFIRPIKTLFETDNILTWAFPDIFWSNPRKEAPVWSMDNGLVLKRESESSTASLEAWGLVDGMPTGKHFDLRVYDDVITETSVYTPEQTQKAEDAFRMSDNLGTREGRQRIVGTIYSHGDYYTRIKEESEIGLYPWHVRVKPWYDVERYKEKEIKYPVLLTVEKVKEKQRKQGPRIFSCQMELDPTNEEMRAFSRNDVQWYGQRPQLLNVYLLVDPANEKKKDSDYSVFAVMGLDVLRNRYLLDMIRDKLNLFERWKALVYMIRKYPGAKVWYEKYGMQADISYFEEKQREDGVYFKINPLGGAVSKSDRIHRLTPVLSDQKFWLPSDGILYNGEDLVQTFLKQEFGTFPFCRTFDMLDAVSRIEDPQVNAMAPVQPNSMGDFKSVREEMLNQNRCEDI